MTDRSSILHHFKDLLRAAAELGASDIHLKTDSPPIIRKYGRLHTLDSPFFTLSKENLFDMARALMSPQQWQQFERNKDFDMAYEIKNGGRYRLNAFFQSSSPQFVIRVIPHKIPPLKELNLPPIIKTLTTLERGLILVTGVTSSGKSSTLASIINEINETKQKHILTIEDPMEYVIQGKKSIITQRELGSDALSFSRALRSALRQDPDIIFIGEIRDKETMETALTAAETGHLVFSTLHTLDAEETIHRIITLFNPHQHQQVRYQLAGLLKAIVSQRLLPKAHGEGLIPAVEVMINNGRIKELIVETERTREIHQVIEESQTPWGMQSFDQSLMILLQQNKITLETALKYSTMPDDFKMKYQGIKQNDKALPDLGQELSARGDQSWNDIEDISLDMPKELKKASGSEYFAKNDVRVKKQKSGFFGRKKK